MSITKILRLISSSRGFDVGLCRQQVICAFSEVAVHQNTRPSSSRTPLTKASSHLEKQAICLSFEVHSCYSVCSVWCVFSLTHSWSSHISGCSLQVQSAFTLQYALNTPGHGVRGIPFFLISLSQRLRVSHLRI